MGKRERWYAMRHKVRLMRRLFRVRVSEGGANYRCRTWLSDRIKEDIWELRVGGHAALF